MVDEHQGGWPDGVIGPSGLAYAESFPMPKELPKDIRENLIC